MRERLQINNDWALALDGPFMVKNNIMQFESTTTDFFPDRELSDLANELRTKRLEYINNSVVHHWINNDAIREIESLMSKTVALINTLKEN